MLQLVGSQCLRLRRLDRGPLMKLTLWHLRKQLRLPATPHQPFLESRAHSAPNQAVEAQFHNLPLRSKVFLHSVMVCQPEWRRPAQPLLISLEMPRETKSSGSRCSLNDSFIGHRVQASDGRRALENIASLHYAHRRNFGHHKTHVYSEMTLTGISLGCSLSATKWRGSSLE